VNRWGLPDALAHTLGGVWAFRARAEREAVVRFQRLAGELADAGAAPPLCRLAERAAEDEARHVDICAGMAEAYGRSPWPAGDPGPLPEAARLGAPGLGQRARLLYELVAFAAITETLNASLMTVAYRRARVPEVRAALRAILADEVGHSRLGWGHLADEHARGQAAFIAGFVPRMLAATVAHELFAAAPPAAHGELPAAHGEPPAAHGEPPAAHDDLLADHGELPEHTRLAIFTHTLREVVFPGLAALGVSPAPGRAWLRAAESP
jgi:hypothetical protein